MQALPTLYIDRAQALARTGRIQDAVIALEEGAAASDPESLFTLGLMRLTGEVLPRDLRRAGAFFQSAAEAGHPDGAHISVAFKTHGAGAAPDWAGGLQLLDRLAATDPDAKRQRNLIAKMALTERGDPKTLPPAEQLSESPDVRVFRGLFTPEECKFLIDSAIPRLQPALVGERSTGREYRVSDRTCETAGFALMDEDPAIHALNRRLAAASGSTAEQGEPLQVLRYSPGQEYRPHYDLATGSNPRCQTLLIYLNDDFEGGETAFVKTGVKFKGRTGDGILFRNAAPDGTPDLNAEHAGLPVTRGTKIIASRWIRAEPIDYYKPLT